MNSKTIISMQRACARGLLFEEWFAEAAPIGLAAMDKDVLKVEYTQYWDMRPKTKVLNPFKPVIVTDTAGWPPEKLKFVIHHDEASAVAHGLATLGKGRFILKGWSQFKQSKAYTEMSRTVAAYNHIFKFRKPKK